MTKLTNHFTMEEFTDSQTAARHGLDNEPTPKHWENIQRIAETMEKVRSLLSNEPIVISSGYRAPKVNAAVGGSHGSRHTVGLAVDFTCPAFGSPLEICRELEPHMVELQIDQLIHEFNTWVHLGLAAHGYDPRHMTLTIDKRGTRHGFERA